MKVGIAYRSLFKPFLFLSDRVNLITNPKEIRGFDLVVFTGGEDISPLYYGEKSRVSARLESSRDAVEFSIINTALELNKKVLGICRGHQLVNVALGKKLIQDIWSEGFIDHGGGHSLVFNNVYDGDLGSIELKLKDLFPKVNSYHHQGVRNDDVAIPLIGSYKGVAELCLSNQFLTTQFHPEWMENFNDFIKLVKEWVDV